jgi:hypothetical protein
MNPITSAETDNGLITEPTLHLCLNEHAIRALAEAARKSNLQLIAEQIEAQLPKAPVEEPTEPSEFGSMVRARADEFEVLSLWHRGPGGGWESEDAAFVGAYSMLRDVEVLRVGVGEPTPEQVEAASAPGVPVEKVRALIRQFDEYADDLSYSESSRNAWWNAAQSMDRALLPKEPTS